MATTGRDVWINLRVNIRIREEFKAAADLRGASMSGLLHQYIVRIIREEKEGNPEEFNRALEMVRLNKDEDAKATRKQPEDRPIVRPLPKASKPAVKKRA